MLFISVSDWLGSLLSRLWVEALTVRPTIEDSKSDEVTNFTTRRDVSLPLYEPGVHSMPAYSSASSRPAIHVAEVTPAVVVRWMASWRSGNQVASFGDISRPANHSQRIVSRYSRLAKSCRASSTVLQDKREPRPHKSVSHSLF